MTLTKADIADRLADKFDIDRQEAKVLVELFFEEIRVALEKGEPVKLSGFGNFAVRDKNSRPGRNPKTGESVDISARRVVTFRPGIKFRERIEKNLTL
ncbi:MULTISPECIES: integration host factor subunit alpha [Orbaceae]|jgi:integration host factor, alpha subunit|uniref:Integration host factor subunit alpha n=2 Tax=Gilliamella TaxID=1193503 RepID=A0A1C0A3Q4_9GAMM|nr:MULTISPECIES: integration host factor subunit alpha [unclassified Gilliamella]KES18928.1 Bacterial nucleoid DNA-binding protein [Gilliamella apicola SCGC AB-598-I20]MCX8581269.1 integration host factor subunit alpha [Gilliamella sp. B3482]MCX8582639.1 integration host factor subunit alpha [Gilliamella sp. B3372]MCX8586747.1 integration host factor subunit alpha [Gilliamella sp. B3562]MCX8594278.1 integration host factor subunit alpha [Gilliamella sp. B3367]MCX8596452.1 integration host fac